MIMKLLLLIGVIAAVYFFFFKKKTVTKKSKEEQNPINDMVECAECGTYTPLDEAILSNGNYYCSSECVKG